MAKLFLVVALLVCTPLAAHADEPVEQMDDAERPRMPTPKLGPVAPAMKPPWLAPTGSYQAKAHVIGYEMKRRWGLFMAGSIMLSASYLPSMILSSLNEDYRLFAAPGIGPLLEIPRIGGDQSILGPIATGLLAFDAIVQLSGITMIALGASTKHAVPVTVNALAPMITEGGSGLMVAGRF